MRGTESRRPGTPGARIVRPERRRGGEIGVLRGIDLDPGEATPKTHQWQP